MGGSSQKIKVAIIDQSRRQQDFQPLKNQKNVNQVYYKTFQQFLENQSLKKLSYIIIREKQSLHREEVKAQNSMISMKIENLKELNPKLKQQEKQKIVTVKQKLISYIQKYSLQKLVIYVLVENALKYKVPDYEVPYLTLVSDSIEAIIAHVKQKPKRQEAAIFKFKRLVKDLYRRVTVRIIEKKIANEPDTSETEWRQMMGKQKISVEFSSDEQSFQQSLISNYNDYIIVSTPDMLTYLIDAKTKFQFDSKIIYFGEQSEISEQKRSLIWMISKGKSLEFKKEVVNTIKTCTDLITDQTSTRPKLTIIFTSNHYDKEEKLFVQEKLIQNLKKITKQKDWKWIEEMKIIVTSNYAFLKDALKDYVFTYVITFDCTVQETENLKAWLKKSNYGNRIYLYTLQLKQKKQTKQKNEKMKLLSKNLQLMAKKANFKIKFQIGPLQSIVLFEMGEKEYKFFSARMGLLTKNVTEEQWKENYCIKSRWKIVDNYYIVCNVHNYLTKLKKLIDAEVDDNNSYFKDLKIVLYDQKITIQNYWDEISKIDSIAFVHFSLTKIQEFLDVVFVPSLKISIFVKKSLPQYIEAFNEVEQNNCRFLKLKGIIVSKNELLKQVFTEEIVVGSSEFQINFNHYSKTIKNVQQKINYMYAFIAKFANLWRVGYNIIKDNQDKAQVINTLRDDLKGCLYKCKSYSLLDVSDQEFDYFYIKKLDTCHTFLDLQIATIYMTTLPHGFNKILDQIFSRPKKGCMIPKVFSVFMVILLTAFCCVEDEVMSNKQLVAYIDDDDLQKKISTINSGDTLFNSSFIFCGKNQSENSNKANHCLFIQFEDIPMLSDSFIKNYLYIERFSFYKESSEYLIAPYTQFTVLRKQLTQNGKFHIYLRSVNIQDKGFIQNVFKANSIDDKQLFNTIKDEIYSIDEDELSEAAYQAKSLYKKAEIISLYEQKKQMIKSIKDSLQYKNFLKAANKQRYLSALDHLNLKQKSQKMTTQIQEQYFKKMLGAEKSLVYFKLNEFDLAVKELEKVEEYLNKEDESQKSWIKQNIYKFKENMNSISIKRHKLFNRAPKSKQWRIYAEKQYVRTINKQGRKEYKAVVIMEQQQLTWSVDYLTKKQQFYIVKNSDKNTAFLPYKIKENYGQNVNSFTNEMVYDLKKCEDLLSQEKNIQKYVKYQKQQNHHKKNDQNHINKYHSLKYKQSNKLKNQNSLKSKEKQNHKAQSFSEANLEKVNIQSRIIFEEKPQEIVQNNLFEKFKKQEKPKQKVSYIKKDEKIIQKTKEAKKEEVKAITVKQIQKSKQPSFVQMKDNHIEQLLGITETVSWQSFYIGDKFVLTKKGKHKKGKMVSKIE